MPNRGLLKSIASGVLGSFVSRNNDVGGYWGIGQLCRIASELGLDSLTFDLLVSSASAPTNHPVIATLAHKYGEMLRSQAEQKGFTSSTLARAILSIEFGTSGHLRTAPLVTRGAPIFVSLALCDERSRSLKVFLTSRCEPHNPNNETRRMCQV